jgi:hypothetical protein
VVKNVNESNLIFKRFDRICTHQTSEGYNYSSIVNEIQIKKLNLNMSAWILHKEEKMSTILPITLIFNNCLKFLLNRNESHSVKTIYSL